MLGTHTTVDGRTMMIASLSNRHLANIIKKSLRKVIQLRNISDNTIARKPFYIAMYGMRDMDPEQAGRFAGDSLERLYPYLAECLLPGRQEVLEEIQDLLVQAVGRDDQLTSKTTLLPMLGNGDDDD